MRAALYSTLNSRNLIPVKAKINIYKMYVKSKITYTGPAWEAQISRANWAKIEAYKILH